MKYVYVLVSDESDYFYEMLYLSIVCLRRYCDGGDIVIVVDEITSLNFMNRKIKINDEKMSTITISVNAEKYKSKSQVSRYLKTSLRNLIDGDYLYIDLDAFPMGSFSRSFYNTSLCMANDMNSDRMPVVLEQHELEVFNAMNWQIPTLKFYNSGVMWVSDNLQNRVLFKKWHSLWINSTEAGFMKDQPALHEALRCLDVRVTQMPPSLNILLNIPPKHRIGDPMIFHMSTIRFEERCDTLFHLLIKSLKTNHAVDFILLDGIRKSRYPWRNRNSVWHAWYSGNYQLFIKNFFRKIVNLIRGR